MHIFICCLLVAAAPASLKTEPAEVRSVRRFVQGFYDWYTRKELAGGSMERALKTRAKQFDPALLESLTADAAAAKKNSDDIVGLDFDPFLNSQEPFQHYKVVEVRKRGETYWASVQGARPPGVKPEVDVIAEVARQNGRWVFVNFHYPPQDKTPATDLLGVLKQLKKDRESNP